MKYSGKVFWKNELHGSDQNENNYEHEKANVKEQMKRYYSKQEYQQKERRF